MDGVLQTMVDEKIGPGERKKEFLRQISEFIGRKDGIGLRSYIDVLIASLTAVGVSEGDKVIVSVLSPKIYLEVFRRMGVEAVIVDTDEHGLLSAEDASRHLDGARAVLYFEPVCQIPQDAEAVKGLGLPVVEDITQSIGSYYGDKDADGYFRAGMAGDIVVAALEEDGVISTGGGAVAVTSSQEYLEKLRRYASLGSPYTELPDMNAALGIVQLAKIDMLLARRNEIYRMYLQSQLKSGSRLFGSASPLFTANGYGFSVIVKARPDDSIAFATSHSVSCRRTFTDSIGHRYQDKYDRFPNAIAAITRAISFPLYPFLAKADLESVQRVISHIG